MEAADVEVEICVPMDQVKDQFQVEEILNSEADRAKGYLPVEQCR